MIWHWSFNFIFQLWFWWYLPCFDSSSWCFEFGPAPVTSLYGPISNLYPWRFTATTRVSLWFHLLLRLGWRLTRHSTCCGNAFARVCSCTAVNQQSYLEEKNSWWLFMRFGQPFQDIHGYTKLVVRWSPFLLQLWASFEVLISWVNGLHSIFRSFMEIRSIPEPENSLALNGRTFLGSHYLSSGIWTHRPGKPAR